MASSFENISPLDLKARLDRGEALLLLDVREPHEWEFNRIEGASHLPMRETPQRLAELPRDKPIVCYCHHGGRSGQVANFLAQQGFSGVMNLGGGIDAWSREVDPEVPTY